MDFNKFYFGSILNLTLQAARHGCKNQIQNRPKIDFFNFHFSKSIFQKSSADQQGKCIHKGKS
jgi:hypothetical protein